MKLFVTDAQLAALRLDAINQVQATYAAHVTDVLARADAELARVADPSAPFVAHLQAEVAFWRMQYVHERQRAEVALDTCRAAHQGLGPVSLPPRDERPPSALASVFGAGAEQELAAMGRADL